jgi:hypothetical protein
LPQTTSPPVGRSLEGVVAHVAVDVVEAAADDVIAILAAQIGLGGQGRIGGDGVVAGAGLGAMRFS